MKIWLDDERPMPQGFDRQVKTADEAIALLKSGGVTLISLDHDLGETENGTGYNVARFIEFSAYHRKFAPIEVLIHSANPVGRGRMEQAINNAHVFWEQEATEKRDALQRALESSQRNKIMSAQKMAEQAVASDVAADHKEYFQQNRQRFLELDIEGLFKSNDDSEALYLFIKGDAIEFYLKCRVLSKQKLFLDRTIQQVEFYRLGDSFYAVNMAKILFFTYLLPSYHAIGSNTYLTLYEKNIWLHAYSFALEHPESYSVFVLDTLCDEQVPKQITAKSQAEQIFNKDWVTEVASMTQTIVITLNPIL